MITAYVNRSMHRRYARFAPFLVAIGMLVVALPSFAFAEGEAQAGNPWMDLLWKAINLIVLVGLIVYFTRKPIGAAFRAMAKETQDKWTGAHQASQGTLAEIAAQKKQIDGLEGELKRMVADVQADGEREAARLLAQARVEAERILANARLQVEQEMAKARQELQIQLAEETLRLAEKLVREKVKPAERKKLMESYVREMEARR
jgi:F-type H+-transporting ATPase subunit b